MSRKFIPGSRWKGRKASRSPRIDPESIGRTFRSQFPLYSTFFFHSLIFLSPLIMNGELGVSSTDSWTFVEKIHYKVLQGLNKLYQGFFWRKENFFLFCFFSTHFKSFLPEEGNANVRDLFCRKFLCKYLTKLFLKSFKEKPFFPKPSERT